MKEMTNCFAICPDVHTPYYCFNTDVFSNKVGDFRRKLRGTAQICYSMKANPWLVKSALDCCDYIEVCSSGELNICLEANIPMERISVGGVAKTREECEKIVYLSPHRISVESKAQLEIFERLASLMNRSVSVHLRLSSGNQFGMSLEQVKDIFQNAKKYPHIYIKGIHYYPGTQKKSLKDASSIIQTLVTALDMLPIDEIQFGAGIGVPLYISQNSEDYNTYTDYIIEGISILAERCTITLECGRCITYSAGCYVTSVLEIKKQYNRHFLIVDGGIHQLSYHGQIGGKPVPIIKKIPCSSTPEKIYTVCGSLCTVNDILAKDVLLPEINIGDKLVFFNAGAYSVTEAKPLFLSRDLPTIVLKNTKETVVLRESLPTYTLNTLQSERKELYE